MIGWRADRELDEITISDLIVDGVLHTSERMIR